jgi:hypothetical protein
MPGFFFDIKLPEVIKPHPDFKKYVGTEDNFQKAVARYLDTLGAFWFHCPNGGSRNAIEASKLKGMGVKAGIPDCLILDQQKGYSGLAIELKVGYNKPSDQQLSIFDKLVAANWLVLVSWSLDEVITIIDYYYDNKSAGILGESD